MATLLRMPAIAAGATDAVLQAWQLPEHAPFSATDVLATVETDKAIVDVEAETDGVLLKTLVDGGSRVGTGAPIAILGDQGEQIDDLDALLRRLGVTDRAPVKQPLAQLVDGATTGATQRPAGAATGTANGHTRVFASPLARRLAREAGLHIDQIVGTGPSSRILRRDVEAALAAPAPAPVSTEPNDAASQRYTVVLHSRLRSAIANRLTESQRTPHFYLRATCRVDALLEAREHLNAVSPTKISINDMVVKAAARAHVVVPAMNVAWMPAAVRMYSSVDIGVAIATDDGLVAPVLRDVDRLSISDVATRLHDFVQRARAKTLRQDEIEGGTLSVTNLGMYGIEDFAAIINPPHAAILAVGAARPEAVVVDGSLSVATVMRVTLSVDHRPVDGAVAADWLRTFTDLIEHPVRIFV